MVSFAHDPTVTASLAHWRTKRPLPSALGSADLRALGREVHLQSVFSARTTNAGYLETVAEVIDDMLSGQLSLAAGRLRCLKELARAGYDPAGGFPEEWGQVPFAERGSLQDLSSQPRIDLMLTTNLALARNYGRVLEGNTEMARRLFPAWELVRLAERETPRGFKRTAHHLRPDPASGWPRRWAAAGESVAWEGAVKEPMIALKDSPIWQALGAGAGGDWSDTLGHPYPPFAFNSGMDWRAVPRAECIGLRLINRAVHGSKPMQATLFSPAKARAVLDRFGPDFKAQLLRELEAA